MAIGQFNVHFNPTGTLLRRVSTPTKPLPSWWPSATAIPNQKFYDEVEYDGYSVNGWFYFKSKLHNRTYHISGSYFDKAIKAGAFDGKSMKGTFYFVLVGGQRPTLVLDL